MNYSSRFLRSSLCLSQAALLTFGSFAGPVLAATSSASSADNARLVQYEDMLFGEKRSSQTTETRLRAIEKNLFGGVKTGSTASRLDAIAKVLGTGKSSLLFPPIPPQLDGLTSSSSSSDDNYTASTPSPAPSVSYGSNRSSSQPNSASSNQGSSRSYQPTAQDQADDALKNAINLYSAGRTAEAEREFKKVVSLDGNNADAHFNLGAIAEGRGQLDAALNEYRQAYRINPNDSELRDAVASVESKLREQVAQKNAEKERQLASAREAQEQQKREQLKSKVAQASSAYKAGNFDQAIALLQQVGAQAPQDADVQYALSQAYKAKGDLNHSRQALNQALAAAPNNQLYRDALSDLNNRQNQRSQDNVASSAPAGTTMPYAPSYSPAPQPVASDIYSTRGVDTANAGAIVPFNGGGSSYGFMPAYASRGGGIGPISSTRLKRAAVGGLAGAAIGALMGTANRSGVKGNAIRGAIMGGALGLLGF